MEDPPALCFVSHLFLESLTDDIETNAWKIRTTVPLYNSERLALLYSHYPISRGTVFQTNYRCPDNKGTSCAEINLFDNLFQPDQIFISRLSFQVLQKENCSAGLQNNQVGQHLRRSPVQPSAQSGWAVRSDQVALSSTQSGLENEGWKLHKLYGQTIPLPGSPHSRLWCSSDRVFPRLSS